MRCRVIDTWMPTSSDHVMKGAERRHSSPSVCTHVVIVVSVIASACCQPQQVFQHDPLTFPVQLLLRHQQHLVRAQYRIPARYQCSSLQGSSCLSAVLGQRRLGSTTSFPAGPIKVVHPSLTCTLRSSLEITALWSSMAFVLANRKGMPARERPAWAASWTAITKTARRSWGQCMGTG